MSRDLLLLVDALAREKNVDKETVFGALELALAQATKKRFKEEADVRVSVDRVTGDFDSFRRWQIVPTKSSSIPAYTCCWKSRSCRRPDIARLGDFVEEALEPVEFGRIGAQAAKQVILQKIRDAEREQIAQRLPGAQGASRHRHHQAHGAR
jgi:N utilization substance protein A